MGLGALPGGSRQGASLLLGAREELQQGLGLLEAEAGVRDALPVHRGRAGHVVLPSLDEVALEHRAEDRPAAVGDLLVLQPGGGGNWLLGVVRRFERAADGRGQIGIESLSKTARKLPLRLRGGSGYVVGGGDPAILLDPHDEADTVRVLLSAGYFDPKESYDSRIDDQPVLVTPVELLESGPDYQIARVRLRTSG